MSPLGNTPKSKVELHVHLDGAARPETIWDLAKLRNVPLPVDTADALKKKLQCHKNSLAEFLEGFAITNPAIAGDTSAITRIAYEFTEDSAKHGIAYSEVRFSPHLLSSSIDSHDFAVPPGDVTPKQVVEAVWEGLKKGYQDFDVKVNMILCCIRHRPEWSAEIIELCTAFRDQGVVGVDIAGDEPCITRKATAHQHIHAFQEARKRGIHRTVHAGENGTHHNVTEAIQDFHAERIGHGYHSLDNDHVYQLCQQKKIHLECCPHSSFLTKSVPQDPLQHPIIRFAADGINFSISTDDPMITVASLPEEYDMCQQKMGLTLRQILQCNVNAAKSSFLPENEKVELIEHLLSVYEKKFGEKGFIL